MTDIHAPTRRDTPEGALLNLDERPDPTPTRRWRLATTVAALAVLPALLALTSTAPAAAATKNEAVTPLTLSGHAPGPVTLRWTRPADQPLGFNVFINNGYYATVDSDTTSFTFPADSVKSVDAVQVEAADRGANGPRASIPVDDSIASPAGGSAAATSSTLLAPVASIFTSSSFWHQSVRNAPVAPDSAGQVSELANQVRSRYEGAAAFDDWEYGIGFYTVPAETPRQDVQFFDCQGKGWIPDGVYNGAAQWRSVPIPADAVSTPGGDKNITIWSPSTDQLWEFWVAEKTGSGWRACWGGRLDHASTSPGYFSDGFGATATGLAAAGGKVGIQEVRAGRIDHAVSLTVADAKTWTDFSWPAQRSDGWDPRGANGIREGTRFRLDPSLDVDSLHLTPLATIIAKAAQEYGFVVQDKGGAVSVIGESGYPWYHATGVNPWTAIEAGTPAYAVLKGFPWDRLQALPVNYGKP